MIKNKLPSLNRQVLLTVLSLIVFSAFAPVKAAIYKICAASGVDIEPKRHYASDKDYLFIPVIGGKLFSLDKEKLTYIWQADLGGRIVSDVFLKDGYVYVVTQISVNTITSITPLILSVEKKGSSTANGKNILWQIDAKTGLVNNKSDLNEHVEFDDYYLAGFDRYISVTDSAGKTVFYDNSLTSGETYTTLAITAPPLIFTDYSLLIAAAKLLALDSKSRTAVLLLELSSPITKIELLSGNTLLIGDERGSLMLYDKNRKKFIWKFRTGGQITNLSVFKNREILTASADGFVYQLSKNGSLRWKHRLSERINGEIYVSGDKAIFGLAGSDALTILNLKDGRAADDLPIGGQPHFVNSLSDDSERFTVFKSDGLAVYSAGGCSLK